MKPVSDDIRMAIKTAVVAQIMHFWKQRSHPYIRARLKEYIQARRELNNCIDIYLK